MKFKDLPYSLYKWLSGPRAGLADWRTENKTIL
jgi:hypothetical protein